MSALNLMGVVPLLVTVTESGAEVTVSVPVTNPVVVDRKRTLMVQVGAAARVAPQVR